MSVALTATDFGVYQEDIDFLMGLPPEEFREHRRAAWVTPDRFAGRGGRLFRFLKPPGYSGPTHTQCACPTMLKHGTPADLVPESLKLKVAEEDLIPERGAGILQDRPTLEAFARVQMAADEFWPNREGA
jgi:hypothetical protein